MLKFVSNNLITGGYFIGTCVNGDKIKNLLFETPEYDSTLLHISRKYNPSLPITFKNNEYTFTIKDETDQTNYFNTLDVST